MNPANIRTWVGAGIGMVAIIACARAPGLTKRESEPSGEPKVVSVAEKGPGQETAPRVGGASEAPVETAKANVPEFQPAFPGQTRAPAVHTKTDLLVTELAKELDLPWAIAFLPDGHLLLTEKPTGKLYHLGPAGLKSQPTSGVPLVDGREQGGLLDVEIDPNYQQNQLIYLSYYEPREGGNGLSVLRARFVPGAPPKLEEPKVIFRMMPTMASNKHAGGRLVFAKDGNLFITLGERSVLEGRIQARDPASHLGKIVRIRPDGSIPKDNPFVGKQGAKPEIWSLGHRNVLGADLDAQGRLWIAEMGPQGGDELNLVLSGKDYGWPTIGSTPASPFTRGLRLQVSSNPCTTGIP
jgi:aldose sugar dehydrogenase